MSTSPQAALTIHSVHFAFPDNTEAIDLLPEDSTEFLGSKPEWIVGQRNVPAAYVTATQPKVLLRLRAVGDPPNTAAPCAVCAKSPAGAVGISGRAEALRFDTSGLSEPIVCSFEAELPSDVGTLELKWSWEVMSEETPVPLGTSEHRLYLVHRRPVVPIDSWLPAVNWNSLLPRSEWESPVGKALLGGTAWSYAQLVAWTCEWASKANGDKEICDAIIEKVHCAGLKYYMEAWDVPEMLRIGGGMCGGWYKFFQALVGAQGVKIERRSYSVDWRDLGERDDRWCAIVVRHPGINRTIPQEQASTFHDVERLGQENGMCEVTEPRYRFWGERGTVHDGHCINLLRNEDAYYLYDACFCDAPVRLADFELPPAKKKHRVFVRNQGSFKSAYLDKAVAFMLGSLPVDGKLYRSEHCSSDDGKEHHEPCETRNGLSVRTVGVPESGAGITFFWGA